MPLSCLLVTLAGVDEDDRMFILKRMVCLYDLVGARSECSLAERAIDLPDQRLDSMMLAIYSWQFVVNLRQDLVYIACDHHRLDHPLCPYKTTTEGYGQSLQKRSFV